MIRQILFVLIMLSILVLIRNSLIFRHILRAIDVCRRRADKAVDLGKSWKECIECFAPVEDIDGIYRRNLFNLLVWTYEQMFPECIESKEVK